MSEDGKEKALEIGRGGRRGRTRGGRKSGSGGMIKGLDLMERKKVEERGKIFFFFFCAFGFGEGGKKGGRGKRILFEILFEGEGGREERIFNKTGFKGEF